MQNADQGHREANEALPPPKSPLERGGCEAPGCVHPKTDEPTIPKTSRLWLWFVAAFVLQAAAWITWFAIASKHQVKEVPLATTR